MSELSDRLDLCEVLRRCRIHGITLSQAQVLFLLFERGETSLSEVGESTGMSFEASRRAVYRLRVAGDVVIHRDQFALVISLSAKGRVLVARLANCICDNG